MSRSTTVSQSRRSDSSSTAPTSWSTDCASIELFVAAASWSRVETASRKEPRAERAMSESADSCAWIPSPSATRRSSVTTSGSRGRWKTKVWQRERTVASTFCNSVVQNTNTRWGGGSSMSFSSACHAASVSWWASSRM